MTIKQAIRTINVEVFTIPHGFDFGVDLAIDALMDFLGEYAESTGTVSWRDENLYLHLYGYDEPTQLNPGDAVLVNELYEVTIISKEQASKEITYVDVS